MSCRSVVVTALLLIFSHQARGQEPTCAARAAEQPAAVSRAWWEALAVGNIESLAVRSAPVLSFVASNGRAFDRKGLLEQAAKHGALNVSFAWTEETVRHPAATVAVVTGRVLERVGSKSATYRYLTVLECTKDRWQIVAAQSSREVASSIRVAAADSGRAEDFVGEYRTPTGKNLRIVLRDGALVLIDPSGAETPLEPIGPALFEAPGVSFQGLIRFAFARDETGKVVSFTRLTSDVATFPRVK